MELGSGIGFTGIAICKTCHPKAYVFSDCHPAVLQQLAENIRLNGFVLEPGKTRHIQTEPQGQEEEATNYQNPKLNPRLIVAELDWGSVTEKQLLDLQPDVVIAAGIFLIMPQCALSRGNEQGRERDTEVFVCRSRSALLQLPSLEATDLLPVHFAVTSFSNTQQLRT